MSLDVPSVEFVATNSPSLREPTESKTQSFELGELLPSESVEFFGWTTLQPSAHSIDSLVLRHESGLGEVSGYARVSTAWKSRIDFVAFLGSALKTVGIMLAFVLLISLSLTWTISTIAAKTAKHGKSESTEDKESAEGPGEKHAAASDPGSENQP